MVRREGSISLGVARLATIAGLLLASPGLGQDGSTASTWASKVEIHGFGGWAFGDTDGNAYLSGQESGDYDARSFSLNVRAQPTESLAINFQGSWGSDRANREEVVTDLDYAFGEWTFSDAVRFRGGVVKHPFGIYTEIFDVGTVRPFFSLPQSIYGPGEIVAKGYQGLGFTGTLHISDRWDWQYDLYGGEIELDATEAANPALFLRLDDGLEGLDRLDERATTEKLVDMVGARVNLSAPIAGLSFGFSAYRGDPEEKPGEEEEGDLPTSAQEVVGAHVQYLSTAIEVRSEWAHLQGGDDGVETDAFYLEIGYRLDDRWQLAARYDDADRSLSEEATAQLLDPSLLRHQDIALGVSYWLSPQFVLKLSYHQVDGNFFAVPELEGSFDDLADLEIDPETELVQFGLQFSF